MTRGKGGSELLQGWEGTQTQAWTGKREEQASSSRAAPPTPEQEGRDPVHGDIGAV